MGSGGIVSTMQTNIQLMEVQIKLRDELTQLQVHPYCSTPFESLTSLVSL